MSGYGKIMNKLKFMITALALAIFSFSSFLPAWAADRVQWDFRNGNYATHPNYTSVLENGNILTVNNGYQAPNVQEVGVDKKVVWEYKNIQANSAERLANGNTLITDSGAAGYPFKPRVLEISPNKEIVWSYEFKSRAQAPRYAARLENGNTLVVIPGKVLEIDYNDQICWSYETGLMNPVKASRLANGNTLIVDKGFKGGKVFEVNESKKVIWSYTKLYGPTDAVRNADGSTTIVDFTAKRVLYINSQNEYLRIVRWQDVLDGKSVLNQWALALAPDNYYYLSVSYSSGASGTMKINDSSLNIYVDDKWSGMSYEKIKEVIYVPARDFLEARNMKMYWDEAKKELHVYGTDRETTLILDSSKAKVGGEELMYTAPLRKVGSTLMLPIKTAADLTGMTLKWDEATQTLQLYSPGKNVQAENGY